MARQRITLSGREIPVHWRGFEVLRALVDAGGAAVSRDALIERLWSGAAVEESNLHKYVSMLRKALSEGDSGREYVETLARIGYRLTVPARPVIPEAEAAPPVDRPVQAAHGTRSNQRGRAMAAVAGVAVVGLLAAAGFRRAQDRARLDEAEQAYRTGMNLLRQRTYTEMRRGTGELRKAVELRPDFARAWAGLAEAAVISGNRSPDAAIDFAERAIRLDPRCGECHAALGFARFVMLWKWQEAGESLRTALELKPDDPQIQYWYAQRELSMGNSARALEVIDGGLKKNPEALNLYNLKAAAHYFARDYPNAVEAADRALAAGLMVGWHWRSKAYFLLPNYERALRALIYDWGASSARSQETIAERADSLVVRLNSGGLEPVLRDLIDSVSGGKEMAIHAESRARFHILLREPDAALRDLESAVEARVFDVIYIGVDPIYDPIRSRAEFQTLLGRAGLLH